MSPILITLGNLEIRWYSVLILSTFIIGIIILEKDAPKQNIDKQIISNLCFYLIIVSILGARLYYCIFNFDYYKVNLLDIFKIWEGGLAIHGGIIASIVFIIFYTKRYNINLLKLLDMFTIPLILGQAIGRWGNFFNREAYGPITTYNYLKSLHIPKVIINNMYINSNYHEPTFLYESIACLIGLFIILIYKYTQKVKNGQLAAIYFIIYGSIRLFIESLRQDSLMFFNFKVAQIISVVMIVVGIILFIQTLRSNYDQQKMGHRS